MLIVAVDLVVLVATEMVILGRSGRNCQVLSCDKTIYDDGAKMVVYMDIGTSRSEMAKVLSYLFMIGVVRILTLAERETLGGWIVPRSSFCAISLDLKARCCNLFPIQNETSASSSSCSSS